MFTYSTTVKGLAEFCLLSLPASVARKEHLIVSKHVRVRIVVVNLPELSLSRVL